MNYTAHDYAMRIPEACGVVGVVNHPDASRIAMLALHALQHRGQESAGIAAWSGSEVRLSKGLGRVADVFSDRVLSGLPGTSAIGHLRYSTTGESTLANAQPLMASVRRRQLAIAHNGNLTNADALALALEKSGAIFQSTTDSELLLHLVAQDPAPEFASALRSSLERLQGAYALALLDNDEVWAVKDPRGIRPLCLGRMGDAWIVASETCALDIVGATLVRELAPGEVLRIAGKEVIPQPSLPPAPQAFCVFELMYYSRPDSLFSERSVYHYRLRLGAELAREHPAACDVVVPIPDSSTPAAIGYARELGVPLEMGLIRSHYVGRTFTQPARSVRDLAAKLKYSPVHAVLAGKRVAVVDDSIVRGTTSTRIVRMLREAGAREVHFRVSAPPWRNSCFYGIDTPDVRDLLATDRTVEGMRDYLGADSLGFLGMEGVLRAVPPGTRYCDACFTGNYEAGKLARRTKQMPRGVEGP